MIPEKTSVIPMPGPYSQTPQPDIWKSVKVTALLLLTQVHVLTVLAVLVVTVAHQIILLSKLPLDQRTNSLALHPPGVAVLTVTAPLLPIANQVVFQPILQQLMIQPTHPLAMILTLMLMTLAVKPLLYRGPIKETVALIPLQDL